MKPPSVVVLIKFLVWVWTVSVMASLYLTFFRDLVDTFSSVFIGSTILLPIVVMDALFHGSGTIAVAMILVIFIAASEIGFVIYNLIQSLSNHDEFVPTQEALFPFLITVALALFRIGLAFYISSLMAKIRLVPFDERCRVKPHNP
jgi:hypothetical protein